MNKRLSKQELVTLVTKLRTHRKKIVTTNGSFDIFHAGHVFLLRKAKTYGDVLIVGVNSDASVKRYKGKYRPVMTLNNRLAVLEAIQYVDYLYVFGELNPIAFINIVRPDVHVNSSEYGKKCVEAPAVKRHGGKLVLIHRKRNLQSTTKIIDTIRKIPRGC
ncbi:MAG: adenylyltransferase/cytidyltransferase family protein [Patescibacteria group bacterium]